MEPNKFEQNIKEQLEQRTIEPSPMAWDRLDAMLTVAEEKKPKRGYGWLYMAASFLGFILIGTIFFSQTEELIDKPKEVVLENKLPENTNTESTIETPVNSNTENTNTNIAATKQESIKTINQNNQSKSVIKEALPVIDKNQNQIAQSQSSPERQRTGAAIINQKAEQDGITKINNGKNADELIAAVDKTETANSKPTVKVDANYLLSQVDGDQPDLSFTERVLAKANKKYKTVKTALANRNNE